MTCETWPDEIRSSVNLAVDAAALMFDALEAADFDLSQIGLDDLPADFVDESGASVTDATETIAVWIERNCESTS